MTIIDEILKSKNITYKRKRDEYIFSLPLKKDKEIIKEDIWCKQVIGLICIDGVKRNFFEIGGKYRGQTSPIKSDEEIKEIIDKFLENNILENAR